MDRKIKVQAVRRLAIAQGHLQKVRRMLEDGEYCPAIIHQSQAVQGALKKVDEMVLHGHLHSCVLEDMHGKGAKNEKLVNEIVELFRKQE